MKRSWHKIEVAVDKLIPFLLAVLVVLIVLDLFFPEIIEPYHLYVEIADYIIIAFFIVDLTFKFIRTKNAPKFLKKYWIEIIAVLPVFVVARIVEEMIGLFVAAEDITRVQRIVHGTVEVEEEGKRVAAEMGRSGRFGRFIRPFARFPRFAKAFGFYKHPNKYK